VAVSVGHDAEHIRKRLIYSLTPSEIADVKTWSEGENGGIMVTPYSAKTVKRRNVGTKLSIDIYVFSSIPRFLTNCLSNILHLLNVSFLIATEPSDFIANRNKSAISQP
jgi:hypothetical protein